MKLKSKANAIELEENAAYQPIEMSIQPSPKTETIKPIEISNQPPPKTETIKDVTVTTEMVSVLGGGWLEISWVNLSWSW